MARSSYLVLAVAATLATASEMPRRQRPIKEKTQEGFAFRLSEGLEEKAAVTAVKPAPATALDEAQAERVLARLTPLPAQPEDEKPFALREKSLPPPRTGRTVKEAFPPAVERAAPDRPQAGPLEIVRRSPEGPVPLASHLSVTFSQPMVAITAHEDLSRETLPVRLSPEPPGQWRWVGTKTLLFEPTGRFPMATDYSVEVPAGVRSAVGGVLPRREAWTFGTPAPNVVHKHPLGGPARRDPVLFAAFDQRIEPQAVLPTIRVRAGALSPRLRLAAAEEDETVKALAAGTKPGRWLAFRAEEPLPPDTEVTITVGPGTPSAEGPKRTVEAQTWTFRTYGPLRVVSHRCGWGGECRPLTPWQIDLSNPVDAKSFRKDMVTVRPELPGLRVDIYGSTLNVRGRSKGRTRYEVTLSPDLPDMFGQTLGQAATVSFDVGPAFPSLTFSGGAFVVLDPAAGPRFSVYSVNYDALRVRAHAVTPEDWPAYRRYVEGFWRNEPRLVAPGKSALDTIVRVQGEPDELVETRLDLAPALPEGLGHLLLVVEPAQPPKERGQRDRLVTWVQATRIGLDAFVNERKLVAWASALEDGRPLEGVDVRIAGGASTATDARGLATLPLPDKPGPYLVARRGNDVALLPESPSWWGRESGWRKAEGGDTFLWYVADDRQMYRPGEEVKVKGWVRRLSTDIGLVDGVARTVAYVLKDSRGNEVTRGTRPLSALGGFDLALSLPPTMNLGAAFLHFETETGRGSGRTHDHTFQVQEFRRPEFEVSVAASEGPHFVGGAATVTVTASYYAGGVLPGAEVSWHVAAAPGYFTPPNRDDFTFGTWVPWWEERADGPSREETFAGRTDGSGRHRLRIDFERVEPPRATSVRAEAAVTDVNRQAWTSGVDLLVHPASAYVGLRSDRLFVQQGEPLRVDAIVTDLDGKAIAGRSVAVRAERLDWEQEGGEWKETAVDPQDCALTSAAEALRCTFVTKEGGTYRVTATVADEQGRRNQSQLRLWVAGGKMPPRRSLEQEKVTLVPDKKDYRGGETAEVLVLAPFSPAEALLTLRRFGIVRTERFSMSQPSHTLKIPIDEGWTPNVHVQVDLVGASARTTDDGRPDPSLPKRPAFAAGEINLSIPPFERTLTLAVAPREKGLPPGGETVLDVSVRDAKGRPLAGADVAVVVVDEAVLALTGYRLPNPLGVFYAERPAGVRDHHLRASVVLGRPQDVAVEPQAADRMVAFAASGAAPAAPAPMAEARMMKMAREEDAAPKPIRTRTDFKALALFVASLPTDGDGHAEVKVKLPDTLTRYRVMAVAAAEAAKFGRGESTITARLPLMVRPSPPRFLNFGDRFELPVVLQNQTDAPLSVDVAVRAVNADITAGRGRRLTVPANDRVEVRFPAAARRAGTARFQVGALAGRWSDAAQFELPVWTPATTEAFATYGQLDQGAVVQPVRAPTNVIREYGGLEITTSATALQALTDAVLYLVSYPFECAEQISSRVIAVAALRDVLVAFKAEGLPKPDELVAAVKRDVERLRAIQNDDGGFPFWRRGDPSWPYISVHVAHALQRAREKGFDVPKETLERSRQYLKDVERHIPGWYGPHTRRLVIAYALNVRNRMGDRDAARARALIREAGLPKLSFEAIGFLLPVLSGDSGSREDVLAIRRHLRNNVAETASTAHFVVSYGDQAHLILHSDRRADAILLEALIADEPGSDLIPKLVEGLLGHRKAGRWENTQENGFVLLALDRYFGTYEKTTPDFVARLWLGERYVGEHAFRGRTTERHHVEVPMSLLAEGPTDLILAKEGAGRLYYRIGMRYAPAGLDLAPADHGFTVERAYEGVDDKADARRDADGVWRLRAGTRVRVRLTMVAPSRRYHVALVDPLPAGLEALNPALATTGTLPPGPPDDVTVVGAPGLGGPFRPGAWWWWTRPWFEHQNLRDERVEAFASLLWEGVYTYSYVARATTPGTFVVPPPRAEEMYHPETFGRGKTDRVTVE